MPNVSDVMTRGVRTMAPGDSMVLAAQAMRELNVGAIPVCDGERLVGMVTDRDIVIRGVAQERHDARLTEVMSPEPIYCYEDDPVDMALQAMRGEQIRRLPVVDRDKRLVGVVSFGDMATDGDERQTGAALREITTPSEPDRSGNSAAAGNAAGGQTR
ncbi:CBS domain-containing protein [Paracidovorax konjaci]|uniref:CBS domain-containing protein n=1 Tax=Paracidovorax konjaci TaxID=32040 RepID=A0A1I1YFS8_9BURK|nr:CBS domain-containing protein [Paracidovorax konjaci]SFE17868.1 CBS domain-containing protein [Paracidovorax konjaci]